MPELEHEVSAVGSWCQWQGGDVALLLLLGDTDHGASQQGPGEEFSYDSPVLL